MAREWKPEPAMRNAGVLTILLCQYPMFVNFDENRFINSLSALMPPLYFSGPMPSSKNDLAGISAINSTREYASSFTMTVQCVVLLKSNLQSKIFEHCNLYYGEAEKAANIVQSVESIIFLLPLYWVCVLQKWH
jgi:hypothetical protein